MDVVETGAAAVRGWLPRRRPDSHKGDYGRVLIVGGSVGYTGAPVLAARGALRCGAGLVSLAVPEEIYPIVAVKCDEGMPRPMGTLGELLELARRCDGVLVGPGLGRSPESDLRVLTLAEQLSCPLVLDADGINALSAHMDILSRREAPTVLTPHDGEFRRLTGSLPGEDRVGAAGEFARAHRCVLVLKGHRTVTAAPDGRVWVNTTGNPGMAVGGSGDVLAGMVLSLIGQGLPPAEAAAAAVYLHGRAGDLAAADKGEYGMLPGDLIEQIPYAVKELFEGG